MYMRLSRLYEGLLYVSRPVHYGSYVLCSSNWQELTHIHKIDPHYGETNQPYTIYCQIGQTKNWHPTRRQNARNSTSAIITCLVSQVELSFSLWKPKAINLLIVLRLAEHVLALPVTGLIITTSVLQYSNILWTYCMQYAICQFVVLWSLSTFTFQWSTHNTHNMLQYIATYWYKYCDSSSHKGCSLRELVGNQST